MYLRRVFKENVDMILKYKVSLPGLKGFGRVYEVKSTTSLYRFHKQMRADMDFPQDQTILFKAVDPDGAALARFSQIDLGKGTVDEITLGQCHEEGFDSFVYFYDTTNKKSVLLDFVEEGLKESKTAIYPLLVETKGPNPIEFENGYVAFEDLPADKKKDPDDEDYDDEDFDDEDEEDDKEEEIYAEDESED